MLVLCHALAITIQERPLALQMFLQVYDDTLETRLKNS